MTDINDVSTDFNPQNFVSVGATTFFTGSTSELGTELWKTDGTKAGTVLVRDIVPGEASSSPQSLTSVNGTLYFSAYSAAMGTELWKSDGTSAGTQLVANIFPGGGSSTPQNLVSFSGSLFFTADDSYYGRELWTTNGTTYGTKRVADIRSDGDSNPSQLTVAGSTLYFAANDGESGTELWKTDGSTGGTRPVRDIRAGATDSSLSSLTHFAGQLYFVATDGTSGTQLWTTNGTDAGTVPVTGNQQGLSNPGPRELTVVGERLFFTAESSLTGRELWQTNGTSIGTTVARDIRAGSNSSSPLSLVNSSGQLYFSADNGVTGRELWKSDGTTDGTVQVADILNPGSASPTLLTNVNGTLYFSANDGIHGTELWKRDRETGVTQIVRDIAASGSANIASLTDINGTLYFSAGSADGSSELWKSNGTEAGTLRIRNSSGNANPGALLRGGSKGHSYDPKLSFVDVDGILYFAAGDGRTGEELWRSDGTAAGTSLVRDINQGTAGSSPKHLTKVGNALYFSAMGTSGGRRLWISDGTFGGTHPIEVTLDKELSDPEELVEFDGKLFFTAIGRSDQGRELWQSDGTPEGTFIVRDIAGGSVSSNIHYLTVVGNTLYFSADNRTDGQLLWKCNGTEDGTVPVSSRTFAPRLLQAGGDRLFFVSQDRLYVTNGTDPGTAQLTDGVVSGSRMAWMNGILYFHGSNNFGFELWRSDGTISGTWLLRDINTGAGRSFIEEFTVVDQTLYFSASNGEGAELWKSDGTTAGTGLVVDIRPGSESSLPQQLHHGNGTLYFVANDGTHGLELWKSDGSAAGTTLVRDLLPDSGSPYSGTALLQMPRILTTIGDKLFFSGSDGITGQELYTVSSNEALPPRLTAPGSSTTSVAPQFTWTSVSGAESYELWIENLSTGASPLRPIVSTTSYTPSDPLGIGKYAAWIRTRMSGSELSAWSPRYEFRINTPVTLTAMAKQQNTARPAVSWAALPSAVKYDLWLSNVSTGQSPVFTNQNLTGTSWSPTADLPLGQYRVWVRGIDAGGISAQWSSFLNFDVVPAPILTSPQFSTFNRRPTFTWAPVTGATKYEVFVRNQHNGLTTYDVKNIATTSWTPPANLPDGPYRWWVQATSANNVTSLWSNPTDVYVGGRTTVTGPFGSTGDSTPTITWQSVQGAVRYELWVSSATTQARAIYQTQLTGTSYTPSESLARGSWRVWVRAVSTSGENSVWSTAVTFSVVSSGDPGLAIDHPQLASLTRGTLTQMTTHSVEGLPSKHAHQEDGGASKGARSRTSDTWIEDLAETEQRVLTEQPAVSTDVMRHGLIHNRAGIDGGTSKLSLEGTGVLSSQVSEIDRLMETFGIDA